MPLYLRSPKVGRTPHYHIRGSYLGHAVERSTKTSKRAIAQAVLRNIEREIERGEFAAQDGPTFASAALAYMNAGGERRPLRKLLTHFGDLALNQINQVSIDSAAAILFPLASQATRNREVYTPISAVLKHAGAEFRLRRPKGSRGNQINAWLRPDEAERLFARAATVDREFALLLILLCYTGLRLSEALRIKCEDVSLSDCHAHIGRTKTGEPRGVFLPPYLIAQLANHPRGLDRQERLFRFAKSGHLYGMLTEAAGAAGIEMPSRAAFHLFRHTYATWMRRYGGRDIKGLVATGAWKSEQSASRYAHVIPSEDARAAELLPTPGKRRAEQA